MHRLSVFVLLATALSIADAQAGERTHYLDLINRAHDRVVSVVATPAGSDTGSELLEGRAIAGGGGVATVEVVADQCAQDIRVEFADGRRALYPAVDLCRHRGLRIQPLSARSANAMMALRQDAEPAALPVED